MRIPVNTLSKSERARLTSGTMDDEALEALFHAIERGHRAKVRAFRRVSILVALISAVLLGMTISLTGPTPAAAAARAAPQTTRRNR